MTGAGVGLAAPVVPRPSSPTPFPPQHITRRSASAAQTNIASTADAMELAFVIPGTATGVVLHGFMLVPLAHCAGPLVCASAPRPLSPQQRIVPSPSSAQLCSPPAAIATALVMPLTDCGVPVSVVFPL